MFSSTRIYRRICIAFAAGLYILSFETASAATLKPQTIEAWETYMSLTEKRIASELDQEDRFLVQNFLPEKMADECRKSIFSGEIYITKMETKHKDGERINVDSGIIHHWFGSIFVADIELGELLEWIKEYSDHEQYFEEVEASSLLSQNDEVYEIFLRLRREKILTVHYNTNHRVEYRNHGSGKVSSQSISTRIAQIENDGTSEEQEKSIGDDDGFLWRLNSYWRFQEVSGGVVVECESISLSRDIPFAVKWAIGHYVNSIPRESMESMMDSIRNGILAKESP